MKGIFKKKFVRIFIAVAVGVMMCGFVGILSACQNNEHVHHYEWKYETGGTEHWKECPDDGVELEGSRGDHVFVDGECECGATETSDRKTYGKAHGQVKLCGLGGKYDDDYSDVAVDMGDEVDPVFDSETGKFSVEYLETGKIYTLTVTKPDYQPYVVSVSVEEEDEDVEIGGNRGMVLQRNSFDTTVNWGKYNLSKVNDETGEISLTNRHFMVLTKDTFDEVAFTLNLNGFKRPGGGVKEGLSLVGDDGKTIEQGIAIAFGQDVLTVRMVGKNKLALWNTWLAGEWKGGNALTSSQEKELYSFNSGEKFIKDFDANSLALTVYRKANNIAVFLNGTSVGNGTVDEKYKDMPCSIGIIGHNAVDDISWKHWSFSVDGGNKSVSVIDNTAQNAHGSVTGIPQSVNFGDAVTLTATPDTDYKISALLINGVNVIKNLDGNTYSFVVTKDTIVEAQFAQIVNSSVNATVSGKSFGKTTALPQGTDVTLTSNGFDEITAKLDADGLKIDRISAGVWTVNIEGYLPVEITVDEGAAYTTAIILERDAFDTTVGWNSYNFEKANEALGEFGTNSDNFLVLSNETFDKVAFTIYLNGKPTDNVNGEQGIALAFGKQVITVRMIGKERLAIYNTWITGFWDGSGAIDGSTENANLYYFSGEVGAGYLTAFDKGELRLTLLRNGHRIFVYLNDNFIGSGSFAEKYDTQKCSVGFVGHSMDQTWKYWNFAVNTEIPDVKVVDGTTENAGGTISITPADVKVGDTVTIVVAPDDTHILGSLTVSGGITPVLQADGTYTFIATQKQHTVTVTFTEKPMQEVRASVSGEKFDGTQTEIAEGTKLVFTPQSGAPVTLTVSSDKEIEGALLPGEYQVTADGYYGTTVTVTETYTIENGITLKKLIFETNSINHSDTYLQGAANANPQKVIADANGKIYEWSIDEYDDVAVTFTFKRIDGGVQGILMNFAGGNKSVIVRFENQDKAATDDTEATYATKAQWCAGEFMGVSSINGNWDFGDGEENANPLNSTLYGKYTGAKGLKLTLVRKGGYVYALIDGKLYSSQRVFDYTNSKLKFALFVEQATVGYEIPFEITTDVDTVLASAGYTLSVFNGSNGEWTESEGKLTANGDACYAQFTAPVGTVTESATIHIGNTSVGDQGFVYQFADGKHLGVRYQYDNGNCKVQYFPDPSFLSSDNTLSTGGWYGWDDIYSMSDEEKTAMDGSGLDLTFIRNGNTLYTLLGNKVIGTKELDTKYADMGGAMFVTITNAKSVEFTYSHAVGDAVTVPTEA